MPSGDDETSPDAAGTGLEDVPTAGPSFRGTMLRGGRDLAVREVAGIVLSLAATVTIFRFVGPAAYGYVGIAVGLHGFLTTVGALGLNVYLIRTAELSGEAPGQVTSTLILSGLGLALSLIVAAPLIEAWTGRGGLTPVLYVVAAGVFAKIAGLAPTAMLERDLRFGVAARIDFASLLVYYAVAVPLVIAGWSYLGICIANTAQVVVASGAYAVVRPVRPSLRLRGSVLREALAFGAAYQGSVWVYQLRDLAAPFLLPRLAGMDALGLVTAANQLVQRMGFFKTVVWRLSISGLARLQNDTEAMARSIAVGMAFQVVLLGGALSLLSAVGSWLIPLAFTAKWDGVAPLFPFLATAALLNGVFTLHTSALYARGRVWAVTKFHIVFVALLWGSAVILVPFLGIWGYMVAEIVVALSYLYLAVLARAEIGPIGYRTVALVLPLVLLPLIAGPWAPPVLGGALWLACAGVAITFVPAVRSVLRETFSIVLGRQVAR